MRYQIGILCVTLLFAACAANRDIVREEPTELPPTFEEARSATYYGLQALGVEPVKLSEGRWEGQPADAASASRPSVNLVRDFMARGDIDSGGVDETVVLIAERSGGTGEFIYIALLDRAGEVVTNTATLLLGDRVQVRRVVMAPGSITAELVQGGAQDPACCPGDIVRRSWTLTEGKFTESGAPEVLGRLSPETVGETEWALRWWDLVDRVPDEPLVTLTYSDGRFAGNSGCNSYTGGVAAGDLPGDIVMSPIAGTRMACPEPQMGIESRFLKNLQAATKIGFLAGNLAVTYQDETGAIRTMLFAPNARR